MREELPVVIKTDVHGSLEAIRAAFDKLATEQVRVRILTAGVGAISDQMYRWQPPLMRW